MPRTVAIAGLGAAARQIHLPALAKVRALRVVGGCDPAVRDGAHPFPVFATAAEMIERTRPDLVVVATPPATHFELCRLALEAGCHVLCEKPFAETLEQADRIVALAAGAGRHVVVNNQYRFMNIHRAARARIGGDEFGALLFVAMEQTFRVTAATEAGWRGQDERRTCKEFGIHALDLCRYFFDEEPLSIDARMPRGPSGSGPDLLNLIRLDFPGGRAAHITLDRLSKGPHRYLDIRLDGERATIETSIGGSAELGMGIRGGTRRPYLKADFSPGGHARLHHGARARKIASDPLDLFAAATARLLEAFVAALDAGTVPPCDASDNRRTLRLMLAAYESDAAQAPVALAAAGA